MQAISNELRLDRYDVSSVALIAPPSKSQHHFEEYIKIGERETRKCTLPTWRHFIAAGTASAISSAIYNPLDCLRVRWQVKLTSETTLIEFAARILRQEGIVNGLWRPGLAVNAAGMACASAVRFGYYEIVRDGLSGQEKMGHHMVLAGLICGATAYCVTTPFHLLKTQVQAQSGPGKRNNYLERVTQIVNERGLGGLWKGSETLAVRGGLFTAGQMLGYDGVKTMLKERGLEDDTKLHVVASISASFGASLLSAPADFIMAKYMNSNRTLLHCIQNVYRKNGVTGFWRGWPIFFFRLTPVMLTYSTVYEQLRFHLGLGYLS